MILNLSWALSESEFQTNRDEGQSNKQSNHPKHPQGHFPQQQVHQVGRFTLIHGIWNSENTNYKRICNEWLYSGCWSGVRFLQRRLYVKALGQLGINVVCGHPAVMSAWCTDPTLHRYLYLYLFMDPYNTTWGLLRCMFIVQISQKVQRALH